MNTINDEKSQHNPNNLKSVFKNISYQMYVKNTYKITNDGILSDDKILYTIYCCEWFKIDKSDIINKIRFNPLITIQDYNKVDKLIKRYKTNLTMYFMCNFVFLLAFIRPISNKFRHILLRYGACSFLSIASTMLFKNLYFKKYIEKLIEKEKGLKQYLDLNLDEKQLNEELLNYGIKVHKNRFLL